ncbi:Putative chitin-binding, type 1, Endochitinase-like superfamily [Septoria linicola]|uniref:Chitin-binding, type 1, Endochitinase-like superfamily n=1 Tax=Septoria linicola TaxID=215465 RepID=A0A9Q9EFY5_9PEZI|nr:Putative chitin-binding, type 1, Endochitinase-like superfamily [Septoria linicola]
MGSAFFIAICALLVVATAAAPTLSSCPETIWVTHYRPLVTVTVTTYRIVTPSWALLDGRAPTAEHLENVRIVDATIDPAACPNAVVSTTTMVGMPSSSSPAIGTPTTTNAPSRINSRSTPGATTVASSAAGTSPAIGSTRSGMGSTASLTSSSTKDESSSSANGSSSRHTTSSTTPTLASSSETSTSASSQTIASTPTSIYPGPPVTLPSSETSNQSSSTRPTFGLPPSTSQSTTDSSHVPPASSTLLPSFWLREQPTVTVVGGGSFDLPCITLSEPTTIQYPPYTTSLCKPHCGDVNFQSKTTLKLAPITTTELCFMPLTASDAGRVTAAFRIPTTTSSIPAPSGMKACPAKHRDTDKDKKCGPDHHYTCAERECCSKDGRCGKGKDFCDEGCRPDWGLCWRNSTSCTMPTFSEDDDDDNLIPVFPIWYEGPPAPPEWKLPWPPRFDIQFGDVHLDCPCCGPIGDILGKLWGRRIGDCGILGCDGLDLGWFFHPLPKLQCPSLLRWICHNIIKCCCCGAGGSGSTEQIGCTTPSCDEHPEVSLDNDGKLCDESLENCEEPPKESPSSSASCEVTSTVTDQTVYCGLTTGTDGYSSQACTSTATKVREGCSVTPKTTSVTTTDCHTMTATLATAECGVRTAINATASTECSKTRTALVSGCSVSDHTTSRFTTSCPTTTATQMSVSCGVVTRANTTHTSCSRTQRDTITGCGVTDTTTSIYNTQCSTTATVTNQGVHCFAYNATVSGSIVSGSATCTSTTRSVLSGCDVSATTTTSITTSELNACLIGAYGGITIEPFTESSVTYASNTSTCVYPTRSDLPSGRKVPAPAIIMEGNVAQITPAAVAKRATEGETMSNGAASCYSAGVSVTEDVYPIYTCGVTLCPNELPSSTGPMETAAPAGLAVTPRAVDEPPQATTTATWDVGELVRRFLGTR